MQNQGFFGRKIYDGIIYAFCSYVGLFLSAVLFSRGIYDRGAEK